jgi:hypothetical protein
METPLEPRDVLRVVVTVGATVLALWAGLPSCEHAIVLARRRHGRMLVTSFTVDPNPLLERPARCRSVELEVVRCIARAMGETTDDHASPTSGSGAPCPNDTPVSFGRARERANAPSRDSSR